MVTLGDGPGDEVLARRISDATGIGVQLTGAVWQGAAHRDNEPAPMDGVDAPMDGADAPTDGEPAPTGGACEAWLASWEDELAGEAGVWAGPLDRLLDAWTECAGYRWQYDGEAELVEVVRSETRVFGVHALVGRQTWSVTTTTSGSGGEATSGSSEQSISSEMSYEPWSEIGAQAWAAAGSEGRVSISAAASTVTVTGLPRAVDRVRSWLEHVNRHVLRPVTLSVHLYSVRFDRGSDYEVGLTGLLPEAFGSNLQVGFQGGAISLVKPVTAGTKTLDATVSALRKVGTTSRLLSVDVPTLNGRPAQFYDLFDQAYLKEVATEVKDGVRSYKLTPGTVSSGFGLSFVARVVGHDEVLARITATIQDRPAFKVFSSAGNEIQLPAGGRRAIVATQRIGRGETLLLTGFRDRSSTGTRSGTVHEDVPFPEGSGKADLARVETALLVTAEIGAPLGISERAGFGPAPVAAAGGGAGPAGVDREAGG